MEDKEQIESFLTMENRKGGFSAAKVYYFLWGGLFVFLFILVVLVGYQISLTKNLSKQGTTESTQYASLRQEIVGAMDFSADPCTDFYQYSCGSLVNSLQLPEGASLAIPTFQNITKTNYEILYGICKDQWPLISDLYQSCMAPAASLTEDSNVALIGFITKMQNSLTDTTPAVLLPLLASLHRMGVDAFFIPSQFQNIYVPNPKVNLLIEATSNTAGVDYTDQGDLDDLAAEIAAWLGELFPTYTKDNATNAVNVEKALDLLANSATVTSFSDLLQALTWSNFTSITALDYSLYTSAINVQMKPSDTILLSTLTFFQGLTSILNEIPQQAISDYLSWRIAYSLASTYPVFGPEGFTAPLKVAQPKPLRKTHSVIDIEPLRAQLGAYDDLTEQELGCVDTVDDLLGDFLGLIFTMKVLDDEVVENIRTVTGGVHNSFLNTLPTLTWIDEYSKEQASYKLSNIVQLIGHPNKLDRYRGLVLDSRFLSNIVAINARVFDDDMSKVGSVFDRSSNEFSATVVNAFYSPYTNTINFPAGILESPFFSTSFPKILQYARMGYVIGHETTHGFDNNGRLWNAFGQYTPIMDSASSKEFTTRAACLVNQYNKFEPVPDHFVDGRKTLGENIADLGGVKNAYKAYKAWAAANGTENLQLSSKSPFVPALTNDQLFFVMMAQTWCTKATDAYLLRQLALDVHSPSKYRVNGPLANFDSFSDAFSCPVGSPMNPSDKCNLW